MSPILVHATPSSLLQQIDQAEKQKQAIEQEKQAAQGEKDEKKNELNQLQYQQGTLKAQLNSFNENLAEENRKYEEICDKITVKKEEIEVKKQELADAKAVEEEQYANMKKRLQNIYEQPDNMYLDMILSSKDFATFLNISDYIFMISEYDNDMLEDYKQTTIEVAGMEAELEQIEKDIEERDYRDMHRDASPLVCVPEAVVVDTSDMSIDEVLDAIISLVDIRE